ncbi:hypothetical protein VTK73DRAFT_6037 [Phialemonium thermophilum]|uniref:UBA domain-containing protein n=1 Tax=Phialemonium thermophilum TaxID=223376 RepID=A0ABR3XW28_9PEZI
MEDLNGLEWSSPEANKLAKPPPVNPASAFYPSLRPGPSNLSSGRNTPLSGQVSGPIPATLPNAKASQDSFSNLVNFGGSKNRTTLSLREQQERLAAEKRQKEEEKRKQAEAQYGNSQFWDSLGQRQTGNSRTSSPATAMPLETGVAIAPSSDDDLFAAFNADTKVDNASYYPPPTSTPNPAPGGASPSLNLTDPSSWTQPPAPDASGVSRVNEDDDPFGLSELKQKLPTSTPTAFAVDEEDVLGDLAKPVDEVRRKMPSPASRAAPEPGKAIEDSSSDDEQELSSNDPFDKAVAQLVDYGFSPENARRGLTESGAGLNVQAAVNWLLDDAHRQAKEKAGVKMKARMDAGSPEQGGNDRASSRSRTAPGSRDGRSPAPDEGDLAKAAAAMGSNLLKTANSLWKTGQKKVQRAVADFQQDSDPSQPKWMRSTHPDGLQRPESKSPGVTDEAMMLESGLRPGRSEGRSSTGSRPTSNTSSRDQSPAVPGGPRPHGVPRWQQPAQRVPSPLDPRSRLTRQSTEEQTAQAYVSPARRKKVSPQPPATTPPQPALQADLLAPSAAATERPPPPPRRQPAPANPPAPRPVRQIPPISANALETSTRRRLSGTAHFKRGDYAAAHASYSSSLAAIPETHPLAILLLCNRALTALKTGEPRQAVADADAALRLIGDGKGKGESIELGGPENEKRDMRDLYGKALTRKAEALEQMEKWAEAGEVWQSCVEAGIGGATAITGRQRCQKALAPKPAPTPKPKPPSRAEPSRSQQPSRTATPGDKSFEAVERLRAANKAAEKEGDEKFALADKVDARVSAWREGKRDNLRALLGSLETVLWEDSGWKKVGLHELVLANRVKVVYMKAIAKTHPDKLPPNASTEVRMIAGVVFSTLNEAWDKFKAENGI